MWYHQGKREALFCDWEFPIVGQEAAKFSSPAPALQTKKNEDEVEKGAEELLAGLL